MTNANEEETRRVDAFFQGQGQGTDSHGGTGEAKPTASPPEGEHIC